MMRTNAIVWLEHQSNVLKNNPLQDPSKRVFPVYLPPSYHVEKNNRYPVLYNLSGWGSNGAGILGEKAPFALSIADMMDQWFEKSPKDECIMVFPDASITYGCSQYVNSPTTGNYMDYLCDELVPWIQQQLSATTNRELTGVFGHSSGGFGALVTGMLRPEVFGHVLSSAGDSHYIHLYQAVVPAFIRMVEKYNGLENMVNYFLSQTNPMRDCSRDLGNSILLLNICMCYAPNPKALFGADLFFDLYTGEIIPEIWEKILSWDPVVMMPKHLEALKRLSSIGLYAGNQDEYGIHLGHRQMKHILESNKIKHGFVEYDAGHSGIYYKTIDHAKYMLSQMKLLQA